MVKPPAAGEPVLTVARVLSAEESSCDTVPGVDRMTLKSVTIAAPG